MVFKSNEKQYSFGISQKALIYDPEEKKYLLMKTNDEYYAKHYGPWDLPGGTVEKGEDFEEALKREVEEETGKIDYEILTMLSKDKIVNTDGKVKLLLCTLIKYLGGEVEISDEHIEYKWESAKEILAGKEYKPWLKQFVEKAEKYFEMEKGLDNWKRTQADFENFKKRQSEQQLEMIKYANQNLILDIIPVIDNFHASTDHIPEDQKENPWVTGIMYIQKQLEKVLSDNNVEEIPVKIGDVFNPEIHEAIHAGKQSTDDSQQSTVNGSQEETDRELSTENQELIKKIVLKGYKMNGRVIRAVRVIVE